MPFPEVAVRTTLAIFVALVAAVPNLAAAQSDSPTLDIYFIDTEGGQATLYVSPSGETMLVDTGNPGERDHTRLMEVLREAGVDRIDHLFLTHYHVDHYGGLEALAAAVPILNYYDHGRSSESDRPAVAAFEQRYAELTSRATRTSVRPGDRVPLAGVDVLVVASHRELLREPIAGAPGVGDPNPACESFQPIDQSAFPDIDNDHSAGFVMTYGEFRTINLGDLMWNYEYALMCPNLLGRVDVYLTSHHGQGISGSAALVHGLRPRVAIMNNGTRKGGALSTFEILHASPDLEDLWQLHWSYHAMVDHNAPGVFIANLDDPAVIAGVISPAAEGGGQGRGGTPAAHSPAHWIKVSAQADGTFTVTNSRNGFSKTYRPAN